MLSRKGEEGATTKKKEREVTDAAATRRRRGGGGGGAQDEARIQREKKRKKKKARVSLTSFLKENATSVVTLTNRHSCIFLFSLKEKERTTASAEENKIKAS